MMFQDAIKIFRALLVILTYKSFLYIYIQAIPVIEEHFYRFSKYIDCTVLFTAIDRKRFQKRKKIPKSQAKVHHTFECPLFIAIKLMDEYTHQM